MDNNQVQMEVHVLNLRYTVVGFKAIAELKEWLDVNAQVGLDGYNSEPLLEPSGALDALLDTHPVEGAPPETMSPTSVPETMEETSGNGIQPGFEGTTT